MVELHLHSLAQEEGGARTGGSEEGAPPSGVTGALRRREGTWPPSGSATAAANALNNEADIKKVQEMLGHSSIATTRIYDRRHTKPEDSPVFRIKY